MTDDQKRMLLSVAQDILRDERHFSTVGSEDRAENGRTLAEMVMDALNEEERDCPSECKACKEHRKNTGEDE